MFELSFRAGAGTLAAALLLSACASKPAHSKAASAPAVKTVVADEGSIGPRESLAGIIAPWENVAIQSTLTEPADEVDVEEGDRVRAGQQLARLDVADLQAQLDADLATARSNGANTSHDVYAGALSISQGVDQVRSAEAAAAQAQASLDRDQVDLERYRGLLRSGYISEQQVATQEITVRNDAQALRSAQASLSSARSNVTANGTLESGGLQASTIAQARATEQVALAQARQVRVQIDKAKIVSPIDGVVVNRNLNPGEYPQTRQIFTLQQVDPVYAVLHGSGAQVAHIGTGAPAGITSSDLRRAFSGKVVGVLNQIAPGSTDFQVKVRLPNPDGLLKPGMAISGTVALPPSRGVRIPVTAFTDDSHAAILTVANDGTVTTTHVAEIADDGTSAVISGIAPGTRVIRDGATSVGDGQKVAYE